MWTILLIGSWRRRAMKEGVVRDFRPAAALQLQLLAEAPLDDSRVGHSSCIHRTDNRH